jgi:ferredoxin
MATGFLINAFLNEAQDIRAYAGFCQRVRFRKSSCLKCQEICPDKAISLNPGPTIKNGCTNCGLCQNICPTEAFRHELHTDQYLLNQARALLGKDRHQPPGEKKRLLIHCRRAQNRNTNSLLVPCLGRITATIILGAALSGFDETVLTKGICSRCRYGQGEKLLADSIAVSRVLLDWSGMGRFEMRIKQKEKEKEAALGRREIFSIISSKVKNRAVSFAYHREKAIREELAASHGSKASRRRLPQRELLCELLEQNRPHEEMILEYNPELPWGKIKIEQRKCSACGICTALCPTKAISKKIENDCLLLYFNSALCTNCSVCRAACPEQALEFEKYFALAGILKQEATVVAAIKLCACIVCGELITAQKNKLCPTCRKRQAWPNYFKV